MKPGVVKVIDALLEWDLQQEQDEPSPDQLDLGPPEDYKPPREVRDLESRFAEWIGRDFAEGRGDLSNALHNIGWAMAMDAGLTRDFTAAVEVTREQIRDDMEATLDGEHDHEE